MFHPLIKFMKRMKKKMMQVLYKMTILNKKLKKSSSVRVNKDKRSFWKIYSQTNKNWV